MRCNVCDKGLNEKEISWNEDIDNFEMCGECLDVALEAAYGSSYSDEAPDEEVSGDMDKIVPPAFLSEYIRSKETT